MAITSALKPGLKTSLVEAVFNEILTNITGYYYFIGRTSPWNLTTDAVTSPSVDIEYETRVREDMIFTKRITSSDLAFTIPRYDWVSGKVFDMYDDEIGKTVYITNCSAGTGSSQVTGTFDPTQVGVGWVVSGDGIATGTTVTAVTSSTLYLSLVTTGAVSSVVITCTAPSGAASLDTSQFYCVTNDRNVYKCIDNNGNSPSTVKPFSTTHEMISTEDGYKWKYMFTVPSAMVNKFVTTTDLPVIRAVDDQYYSRGALSSVTILNYGTGYSPDDTITVTGNGHLTDNRYRILAIQVTNPGSEYTSVPTVTVEDPFTTTSFVTEQEVVVGQYLKVNNRIYEVTQSGTTGAAAPTHTSFDPVMSGTTSLKFVGVGITPTAVLTDGKVTDITMKGIVGYINLEIAGAGYDPLDPPLITISGDGAGATATAIVSSGGYISGIVITDRGSDYTSASVVIDAPDTRVITFSGATAPSTTLNTITKTNHGFTTGTKVVYSNGGGTSIGGLTSTTSYYVIAVDVDTIKLAATYIDAVKTATAIDLTSAGVGSSHTLTTATVQATASIELFYGYGYNNPPVVTVSDPLAVDFVWAASEECSVGDIIKAGSRLYEVTTGGSGQFLGISPPTHTTGTVLNGDVNLLFVGETAQGEVVALQTQAKMTPVVRDGQIVNVIIQDPGVGYTVADVKASGQGEGAILSANLSYGDLDTRQATTELLAIPGTIDAISLLSNGSGYVTASISIDGDGTGCTAEAVIEGGTITKIIVTDPGFGYTKATVTITGNESAYPAYARAIISPYDGHGRDAVKELFATDICMSTTIALDVNQGFIVDNDYRQIGILKNPRAFNNTTRYTKLAGSTCWNITGDFDYDLIENDMIITDSLGNRYRVVAKPSEQPTADVSVLVQSMDNGTPQVGGTISYDSSQAVLRYVSAPAVDKYSGDLMFIDNRTAFQPTEDQTLSIKTVIRL